MGPDGPLCFDWQLPRGCHSTSHPEKLKCSGCGKASHGAQDCARAERLKALSPYHHWAWEAELMRLALLPRYPPIVEGLKHGSDLGIYPHL